MNPDLTIESWTTTNPRWNNVVTVAHLLDQEDWLRSEESWHHSSHTLVAATTTQILGFLRYVVQEIGSDQGWPTWTLSSSLLFEGKVLAFGVLPEERRQGVGRALQEHLIHACKQQGCFQIRSHSSLSNTANYRLKLALGFGVHPLPYQDGTSRGVYFVLPLSRERDIPK